VGRVRGGKRDALLGKGGLLQVLDKLWQDLKICMCPSKSYLQALEDKEERLML
jgi:predicted nucleic acid-binding protein